MNRRTFGLLLAFALAVAGVGAAIQSAQEVSLPTASTPIVLYSSQTRQDLRDTHLAAIDKAEKSITLIIFTMRDRRIIHALNRKAEDGVDVYVIYDARAASNLDNQLSKKVRRLKRDPQGITHQKILIVDDELILLGTSNMTNASLRYYVNLVMGIWSPEIAAWLQEKLGRLTPFDKGPGGNASFPIGRQSLEAWFLPSGPGGPKTILNLIRSAKTSLQIAMFTWTRLDFAEEVIRAHQRGVDVEVIVDKQSGYGASAKVMQALSAAGVPLHFNRGGNLLHAKTMIVDHQILVNGSANWTKSAFTRNDDCFVVLWPLSINQQKFLTNFWDTILSEALSADSFENHL